MSGVWHAAKVALFATVAAAMAFGATDVQSAVNPIGPQAGKIANLWWFFFWLLGAIYIVVMIAALWTLTRPNRGLAQEPLEGTHQLSPETERRTSRVIAGATITTIVILFVLIVASVGNRQGAFRPRRIQEQHDHPGDGHSVVVAGHVSDQRFEHCCHDR